MFSVYQHWDRLKVCVVGKSYPPEFYNYISNSRVRNIMERIAIETEEDFQKLIKLLRNFDVKVLRPEINSENNFLDYYDQYQKKYLKPPVAPRDHGGMFGNMFFIDNYNNFYNNIINSIPKDNIIIYNKNINSAMVLKCGKDLYICPVDTTANQNQIKERYNELTKNFRCTIVDIEGHGDGVLCAVKPNLLIVAANYEKYKKNFPTWEVVKVGPSINFNKKNPLKHLKIKNKGKWWIPGEELNDEFTEYVETFYNDWVGYVEESVFDVNMLIIDKKNVICNTYNKNIFNAFMRHNITPHILNFRHRYFWDGGLHCITLDLDREGKMQDYFPSRGEPGEHLSYLG